MPYHVWLLFGFCAVSSWNGNKNVEFEKNVSRRWQATPSSWPGTVWANWCSKHRAVKYENTQQFALRHLLLTIQHQVVRHSLCASFRMQLNRNRIVCNLHHKLNVVYIVVYIVNPRWIYLHLSHAKSSATNAIPSINTNETCNMRGDSLLAWWPELRFNKF